MSSLVITASRWEWIEPFTACPTGQLRKLGRTVWANLPPALVYHCRRPRP